MTVMVTWTTEITVRTGNIARQLGKTIKLGEQRQR